MTIKFKEPFFKPPVVLATVLNGDSNSANIACSHKGPLANWLEVVNKTHSRVCIKDSAGYNGQRTDVIVNFLVIGGNYGNVHFPSWSKKCYYLNHPHPVLLYLNHPRPIPTDVDV
ncbi:uncharacterized protein LOC110048276 [Orbicella faveolata]|uniref:uncharacterized protein LOC110048276 n=1 Tax=Orbicella faveolata TaxID=48498 RepID=UPI0009E3A0B3|nr:uncharacterized protein LOC110048276 [Orbicella faveolata]